MEQLTRQASERSQLQQVEFEAASTKRAMENAAMAQNLEEELKQANARLHAMKEANALNFEAQALRAEQTTVSYLNVAAQVTTVSAQVTALQDQEGAHHAEVIEEHHGTQARRVSAYS